MILHNFGATLLLLLLLVSNTLFAQEKNKSQIFLEKFKPHLGNYYEGEIIAGGKDGDGFVGNKLLMQVMSFSDREVRIPFYVGENKSRTWILSYSNNVLTLKHDHRHEDGSPDKITFYGGTSPNEGSDTIQIFPADNETCELIDYACQNVWWITMDGNIFTYNLRRIGSDRVFTVQFDLTKPVQSNFSPW
ncbi:hypothetical protein [Sphingobacterium rhinopitheci]|uniref:hypothetical protein n=1 Tax=Sphingobacterium rhinopitheci TaxID=2781960 RepID=UPI001F51EBBE|nr:hypothetical protein [Sphingobacterium rhinopitheci]MCI0920215.1 hypothetical protein [Sphingobacterium rhinopitheci]